MMPKFRAFYATAEYSIFIASALLLLRIVAGIAFMIHGWAKIQNPFSWMGPEAPVPGIFQALAALSELGGGLAWIIGLLTPLASLGGGLAWIIGLLTPLASLGIGFTMLAAVSFHVVVQGDPFVSTGGPSFELAAVYFCIAVLFIAVGPGFFSFDRKIFGPR